MHLLKVILPCLLLMYQPLKAEVTPPNYTFNLSEFNIFYPGMPAPQTSQKWLSMQKKGGTELLKGEIRHSKYIIPIFLTIENKLIIDFYAKLPSYFLHDIFLKELVTKHGKQDIYKMKDEHALYLWNREDIEINYSATCTITCFPLYITISSTHHKKKSLINFLKK